MAQEVENDYGYPEFTYIDKCKNISASRRTVSIKDMSSESGWWSNAECKFVINYKEDIDSGMYVAYKGKRYAIKYISEFREQEDNKREYMQIVVTRAD